MLLYLFAIFCVSLAAEYSVLDGDYLVLESETEGLKWPDRYTVKATKLSLTSNLVEDYTAWRTNDSSRVDYNGGAVKQITFIFEDEDDNEKYEIRPETKADETITTACIIHHQSSYLRVSVDEILPVLSEEEQYEAVGNETIVDKETVKFVYVAKDHEEEVRKTIWAIYKETEEEEHILIPVRFEVKEFNSMLGSLTRHEIVDYFEFDTDFDDDVFDTEEYNCVGESKKHDADSKKITEELSFIDPENINHVDHVFRSFKIKFNREYAHEREHILRKTIFRQNMRLISSTNRQKLGYRLAINHFADRTPEEMERSRGFIKRPEGKSGNVPFPYNQSQLNEIVAKLPKEYDLRNDGLISPVKNQEDCGSCWSFGATSAVEGALARINGGRLMSLSNQALIDCAWAYGVYGCDGGFDYAAYDWMMAYGLPTEEEYGPYKNKDDFCHIGNMTKKFPIRGYTDVTPFNNEALKAALVNHGPLSIPVHVTEEFGFYSSGIFYQNDCDPSVSNHVVALAGYGEKDGELFWVLKNSWGTSWGIDGYMLIAAKDNNCGVTTKPTYVVF